MIFSVLQYLEAFSYNQFMNQELYQILDFILNRAEPRDIQAIEEAVNRRNSRTEVHGMKGIGKMAQSTARNLEEQMTLPMDSIRQTIRDFVVRMIKEQVPDIPPEQLDILLNEWVPDPNRPRRSKTGRGLPHDVIYTMVSQFISFSLHKMGPQEQADLRQEMPHWPELYWAKFPPQVQKLVSAFLKGGIDEEAFWQALEQLLA